MSELPDDDVSRRLRAANPVPSDRAGLPSGRSVEQLMEQTMASTTNETGTPGPTRWRLMVAAAVVVAAAAGGGAYLANRGSDTSHQAKSMLSLKMPHASGPIRPGGGPGQSCIVFSVDLLAHQQLAFSGTVVSIADSTVKLSVDHWYKGGSADEVDLATPGNSDVLREIGVNFGTGHRYLVSAKDGTVTGCGYTAEYSADLARDFAKAFGS